MSADTTVNYLLRDPAEILQVLTGQMVLAPQSLHGVDENVLASAAATAVADLKAGTAAEKVDGSLAQALHGALDPLRRSAPHVLNDPLFWQWLAFHPFRDYTLQRWCGGSDWLDAEEPSVPTGAMRFVLTGGSVKSHARHSARRLYLYADCSFANGGTYDHVDEILGANQDILTAVFERRLGLSPTMTLELIRAASAFTPTAKTPSNPAVSARTKYRNFFRQVNLLVSTVAVEFLDNASMATLFLDISAEIG